jgi:hypothetical protein
MTPDEQLNTRITISIEEKDLREAINAANYKLGIRSFAALVRYLIKRFLGKLP